MRNVKATRWMLWGICIGVLLSLMRMTDEPEESGQFVRMLESSRFFRSWPRRTSSGMPIVRNVLVYPKSDGHYCLTGDILESLSDGRSCYMPFQLRLPALIDIGDGSSVTLSEYAKYLEREDRPVKYTVAWWTTPAMVWVLWTGGSILIIGVIFPAILRLLYSVPATEEPETAYDLERFSLGNDAPQTVGPEKPTEQEIAKLDATIRQLEARVQPIGPSGTHDKTALGAPPSLAVVPLSGYEEPIVAVEPDVRPRDYQGEYYPVARRQADENKLPVDSEHHTE
ncbi:MAG TPA: hypothetical protein VGN12_25485 [Pirellulales bacterium]